jgi:hypothetical protein
MDLLTKKFPTFSLWQVCKCNLLEFSNFVININHKCYNIDHLTHKLEEVVNDDIDHYNHSFFYAIKDLDNKIIGTVRVCLWDEGLVFPLQRNFGIEIKDFKNKLSFKPNKIWHLGRLAVDPEAISHNPTLSKNRVTIFKVLLLAAFRHICSDNNNVMIAECDSRLNEKVKLFGINSVPIGKSMQYLGSETIPIYNTGKELKQFLNKYEHIWDL